MSVVSEIEGAAESAVPQLRSVAIVGRLALIAAGAALVALAYWWVFVHPHALKQQAAQAKADTVIQAGATQAATDAVKITVDVKQHAASIDAVTRGNEHAILSASGAAAPVDPAMFGALHDALCLHDAYQSEPDCAPVRTAGGRVGAAPADAGGQPAGDSDGG